MTGRLGELRRTRQLHLLLSFFPCSSFCIFLSRNSIRRILSANTNSAGSGGSCHWHFFCLAWDHSVCSYHYGRICKRKAVASVACCSCLSVTPRALPSARELRTGAPRRERKVEGGRRSSGSPASQWPPRYAAAGRPLVRVRRSAARAQAGRTAYSRSDL
jgi:hypothetical protein